MNGVNVHNTEVTSGSNWRRLRHTPLRDLVRGRVTGRFDLAARIAAAGLPQPVGALVLNVARRTRLWRIEKVDVVDELIAHFLDGLEAGHSAEQLIERFGDPARVAKLIRRAKKRQRPLIWRAWLRAWQVFGVFVLALLIVYGVAAIRFFIGRPSPSHDYLAQINAPILAVPMDHRAWPLYRDARIQLGTLPEPKTTREPLPGEIGWDGIEPYLVEHTAAIALVRQGASRPALGYVISNRIDEADLAMWTSTGRDVPQFSGLGLPGLRGVLLPYLSEVRSLSRVLGWDLLLATKEGDGDRVHADAQAVLGLAEHVGETPFVVNQLFAMSMTARLIQQLGEALVMRPEALSDEQLHSLAHELAGGHEAIFRVRLDGERMGFQDFIQHLYTDDGNGDGRLTAEGFRSLLDLSGFVGRIGRREWWRDLPGPVIGMALAGRKDMTRKNDEVAALVQREFQTPLWLLESSQADDELARMMDSTADIVRYFPVTIMTPALSKVHIMEEQLVQERDGLLVAIALELHHRRHGQWPASLNELTPSLLPSVPLDRYSGQAIGYRLINGRPVVYSIGVDRDDDGGVPPRNAQGRIVNHFAKYWRSPTAVQRMKEEAASSGKPPRGAGTSNDDLPDGDWILWPQPQEPIEWQSEETDPRKVSHMSW